MGLEWPLLRFILAVRAGHALARKRTSPNRLASDQIGVVRRQTALGQGLAAYPG